MPPAWHLEGGGTKTTVNQLTPPDRYSWQRLSMKKASTNFTLTYTVTQFHGHATQSTGQSIKAVKRSKKRKPWAKKRASRVNVMRSSRSHTVHVDSGLPLFTIIRINIFVNLDKLSRSRHDLCTRQKQTFDVFTGCRTPTFWWTRISQRLFDMTAETTNNDDCV